MINKKTMPGEPNFEGRETIDERTAIELLKLEGVFYKREYPAIPAANYTRSMTSNVEMTGEQVVIYSTTMGVNAEIQPGMKYYYAVVCEKDSVSPVLFPDENGNLVDYLGSSSFGEVMGIKAQNEKFGRSVFVFGQAFAAEVTEGGKRNVFKPHLANALNGIAHEPIHLKVAEIFARLRDSYIQKQIQGGNDSEEDISNLEIPKDIKYNYEFDEAFATFFGFRIMGEYVVEIKDERPEVYSGANEFIQRSRLRSSLYRTAYFMLQDAYEKGDLEDAVRIQSELKRLEYKLRGWENIKFDNDNGPINDVNIAYVLTYFTNTAMLVIEDYFSANKIDPSEFLKKIDTPEGLDTFLEMKRYFEDNIRARPQQLQEKWRDTIAGIDAM